jgi:hypothetical protein
MFIHTLPLSRIGAQDKAIFQTQTTPVDPCRAPYILKRRDLLVVQKKVNSHLAMKAILRGSQQSANSRQTQGYKIKK